jgi:DNA-binding MarR family transcriptional regulator
VGERERIDAGMASWAQSVPDLDVVTMRTALLFARVTALGHKHVEAAFAEVGLSAGEFDVLASLMHAPDRTSKPSVLARSGMLSPAGMTHRLDLLERAGFVERRPDPDDRRSTLVVLTQTGEAKAIEAARAHVAAEAELFGALGPSDGADLRRLLETLLDTYAAVNPDPLELHT